ncbi:protein of unknown function DUF1016 [Pseudopedobacter saltans DSM 12145]|uniref:YhcG N-terminal domain-containing protein n=1 Tax=Pseudopedobacter saltans (strain ATCC 51119 / DSM 12145 / JCM 21818 / CCUG 39354 / LMG 10337 / NBRC 100064 / NCIMB 13643) TaxID=762903 RepID=F0SDE0_PSESL|nr:DUF1016 N-terminal domain-containing protein [Pseudopedobacter saltans]ADY53923.1 protein of unknown function DUF1016 [Pseudopedobacter saltans DSM 12145]
MQNYNPDKKKELSTLVEERHYGMLSLACYGILNLFWNIGKKINDEELHYQEGKQLIERISNEFVVYYGTLFSLENISRMKLFADNFPDVAIVEVFSSFLSWEHIQLLFDLEDYESRCLLMEVAIREGLNVNELKQRLNSMDLNGKKFKGFKRGFSKWKSDMLHHGFIQKKQGKLLFPNLFKPDSSNGYYLLMTSDPVNKVEELGVISDIIKIIEEFKANQTRFLNGYLNIAFYEIGEFINYRLKEGNHKKSELFNLSSDFAKEYGKSFIEGQINFFSVFAKSFEKELAGKLAYIVTWEHLLVILELETDESKLFFIKATARERLSVDGLREKIRNYVDAGVKFNSDNLTDMTDIFKIIFQEQKTLKSRGNIVEGTTQYIKYSEDVLITNLLPNIFQNKYFPLIQ